MRISLIVAFDENKGIGYENRLPWKLSKDLKRFKQLTLGHPIIMGRKTYESIGRPLPGRKNIVITRDEAYRAPGCHVCHSLSEAIEYSHKLDTEEVFIIGGASIFASAIDLADRFYLTLVHGATWADTYFPEFNFEDWVEIQAETVPADEDNDFPTTFKILEKRSGNRPGQVG